MSTTPLSLSLLGIVLSFLPIGTGSSRPGFTPWLKDNACTALRRTQRRGTAPRKRSLSLGFNREACRGQGNVRGVERSWGKLACHRT
ncbi:hypothetical protein B0T16DRAFT_409346, partial [Cercophora newfieldiana]